MTLLCCCGLQEFALSTPKSLDGFKTCGFVLRIFMRHKLGRFLCLPKSCQAVQTHVIDVRVASASYNLTIYRILMRSSL